MHAPLLKSYHLCMLIIHHLLFYLLFHPGNNIVFTQFVCVSFYSTAEPPKSVKYLFCLYALFLFYITSWRFRGCDGELLLLLLWQSFMIHLFWLL